MAGGKHRIKRLKHDGRAQKKERNLHSATETRQRRRRRPVKMVGDVFSEYYITCHSWMSQFSAVFWRTHALLRLQPFVTLDLLLNESQSNSNPQISLSLPKLLRFLLPKPDYIAFITRKTHWCCGFPAASLLSIRRTNEFEADHHQSQGRERGRERETSASMDCAWLVGASLEIQQIDHGDILVGRLWSPSRSE